MECPHDYFKGMYCDICFPGRRTVSESPSVTGSMPSLADSLPLTCEDCIQCSTHNDEQDVWCALKGAIVDATCEYFESVDGRVRA